MRQGIGRLRTKAKSSTPRVESLEGRSLLSVAGAGGLGDAGAIAIARAFGDAPPGIEVAAADSALGTPRPAAASGSPRIVAILDSGIDTSAADPIHYTGDPALLNLGLAYNALDGAYGASAVADQAPGLQGTRAANYVARGVADAVAAGGTANVQIVPIKVYDAARRTSPAYGVINGILHAADLGAAVIDVNYVASQYNLSPGLMQKLSQAIQYARAKGAVVVTVAGDGFAPVASAGVDIDLANSYRTQFPADVHLGNMLVVAATDRDGNLGPASNFGAIHVDVGAPTDFLDRVTPFAASYASGVAAVVAAARPDWSATQVVNRIKQAARPTGGLAGRVTTGGIVNPTAALAGVAATASAATPGDLDGDLRTDFAVFGNLPNGFGYGFAGAVSAQGYQTAFPTYINNGGSPVGGPGSIPLTGRFVPGGESSPALFAPEYAAAGQATGRYNLAILGQDATGQYYVTKYVAGVGTAGDIPVVGDFFGTGQDDLALYGSHDGQFNFRVLTAASGYDPTKMITLNNNGLGFGGPGSAPVVGDFFGDGKDDIGVYGPEYDAQGRLNGIYDFAALDSGSRDQYNNYARGFVARGVGQAGDIPVAGDYDGDGKADVAVYGLHNSQYNFRVVTSSSGFNPTRMLALNNNGYSFGTPGSVPVAGDFDGDGRADLAVFGPGYNANGQPSGLYNFAALLSSSKNVQGYATRSIFLAGFGGPTTVALAAPPVVRYFGARSV